MGVVGLDSSSNTNHVCAVGIYYGQLTISHFCRKGTTSNAVRFPTGAPTSVSEAIRAEELQTHTTQMAPSAEKRRLLEARADRPI
jgi:hypothetical protein